jgi:poly-gamma-glutamate capsule biosynthesis protein CapA/YwtB (metallophosphatase superfamily)
MSRNRHKSKSNNHPKPITKLIDGSSYSPNSIGGRIDLQALRDKLFCEELNESNQTNHNTDAKDSEKSLQGKGKA